MLISVYNCRAVVSRWVKEAGGFALESAENWPDLQDDAIRTVEQAGGAINLSGYYPYPAKLRKKAKWDGP